VKPFHRWQSCLILSLFLTTGCNVYQIVDKPSGDKQILAAARDCFDQGDYECAGTYYLKLSPDFNDEAQSEIVFISLKQNGMGVGPFMDAVINGSSSGGKLVTKIANGLVALAGETTRLNYFHAYQKYSNITDSRVQGLIRFVTSLSLMAELLAEDVGSTSTLLQTDLVSDPTACLASTAPLFTGCGKPAGKKMVSGTATIKLTTAKDTDLSGSPSLAMINAAAVELNAGIKQMQTTGSLGNSTSDFTTNIISSASLVIIDGTDSPAYRKTLVQYEIGGSK
jgi:hypothetical protein